MKKLLLTLLLIPLGFGLFAQPWTTGMTPAQTRSAVNGAINAHTDSIGSLRNASNQNYGFILSQSDSIAAHTARMNARLGIVGNATAPPYFDGSSDGGQILYFYGNNGYWTALQGGAPTANRSYRLPIAPYPSAGDSAYMVMDEYGNMLLVPYVAATEGGGGGVTPTSSILYWDSVNNRYSPYINSTAASTSGRFYLGGTKVAAANNTLNYTGGLYVNSASGNNIESVSSSGTAIYATSTTGNAIIGRGEGSGQSGILGYGDAFGLWGSGAAAGVYGGGEDQGILGQATGDASQGVYGYSSGQWGTGVYGSATGVSSIGVYGSGTRVGVYGWAPLGGVPGRFAATENSISDILQVVRYTDDVGEEAFKVTSTGTIIASGDTLATMEYARSYGGTGTVTESQVRNIVGDSVQYPSSGIALSTGSAWGTSITNNSTNWNTAYGWGNHASAGYVTGTPWTSMGYLTTQTSHADVVQDGDFGSQGIILRGATAGTYSILTNNSTNWNTAYGWGNHASAGYAPLANPNFTGVVRLATNDTLATQDYARSYGGAGTVTESQVRDIVSDSIQALLTDGVQGIILADSTGYEPGNYIPRSQLDDALSTKANLASPTFTGTVSGISAAMVGLGNVNNTSDVNKPISTAQQTALNLKANTNLVNLLSDTIAIFAFGAGGGATSDSACFQTTSFYGSFFNAGSDSLIITNTRAVMVDGAGIDTCSVAIQFHTTFNSASATILNGAATATGGSTKFTTGLSTAITSNNRIPPNTWVWMETPYVSVGNKPYMLSVTMSGYKKSMY